MSGKFVPLVDRVHKPWQKVIVVLLGIALCLVLGAVIDKAMAQPIPAERYSWHPPKSKALPVHTVKVWKRNRYGDLVPRYVRGHQICKRGYYAVQSKYTGASCARKSTEKKVRKAVVKCAAYMIVGRYWGGVNGLKAAAAGCGIDWFL